MAAAIEDEGFELRDTCLWIYGQGFPKSLDLSKAVDDKLGAEREVVGEQVAFNKMPLSDLNERETAPLFGPPVTPAAALQGVGTALKPAFEPIVVARKPIDGTLAENVMRWGTGGLNIDACRIGDEVRHNPSASSIYSQGERPMDDVGGTTAIGRWPANAIFQHAEGCIKTGRIEDTHLVNVGDRIGDGSRALDFGMGKMATTTTTHDVYQCVSGCPVRELELQREGASLFFYVAKPSKGETEAGLDDLPEHTPGELTDRKEGSAGLDSPRAGAGRTSGRKNTHTTKKPIELMRYLVRLVAPPHKLVLNGEMVERSPLILDPFTGSGTTGLAALVEGCRFIGWEQSPEYHAIACGRLRSIIEDPRQADEAEEIAATA